MKTQVIVYGCYPALRGLNAQQFINAIEPRLIDIRNPRTGLQVDLFGRVSAVQLGETQNAGDSIAVEIEVDDAFLQRHALTPEELREALVARITKLRHPATGAMAPVRAALAA
jgi:hypothetical protein